MLNMGAIFVRRFPEFWLEDILDAFRVGLPAGVTGERVLLVDADGDEDGLEQSASMWALIVRESTSCEHIGQVTKGA